MSNVIGHFVEVDPSEFLVLVSLQLLPAAQPVEWSHWGTTADFVTSYFGMFLGLAPANGDGQTKETYESSALRYILNELIENAVKFNQGGTILVQVGLVAREMVLLVENVVTEIVGTQLRPKLVELISQDPTELFLRRVEERAENPEDDDSGLGFITMMSDYEARLGWKLSPVEADRSRITLSTMARLSVQDDTVLPRSANGGR